MSEKGQTKVIEIGSAFVPLADYVISGNAILGIGLIERRQGVVTPTEILFPKGLS